VFVTFISYCYPEMLVYNREGKFVKRIVSFSRSLSLITNYHVTLLTGGTWLLMFICI